MIQPTGKMQGAQQLGNHKFAESRLYHVVIWPNYMNLFTVFFPIARLDCHKLSSHPGCYSYYFVFAYVLIWLNHSSRKYIPSAWYFIAVHVKIHLGDFDDGWQWDSQCSLQPDASRTWDNHCRGGLAAWVGFGTWFQVTALPIQAKSCFVRISSTSIRSSGGGHTHHRVTDTDTVDSTKKPEKPIWQAWLRLVELCPSKSWRCRRTPAGRSVWYFNHFPYYKFNGLTTAPSFSRDLKASLTSGGPSRVRCAKPGALLPFGPCLRGRSRAVAAEAAALRGIGGEGRGWSWKWGFMTTWVRTMI
jgi:hypothetical protein